jgi:hypothetical protein
LPTNIGISHRSNIFSGDELIVLLREIFTSMGDLFLCRGVSPNIENCSVISELILVNQMGFAGGGWGEAVGAFPKLSVHSWLLST